MADERVVQLKTDKVQKAYDALSELYDVGSIDDFNTKLTTDPTAARKVYDALSEKYDVGSYGSFGRKLYKKGRGPLTDYQKSAMQDLENLAPTTGQMIKGAVGMAVGTKPAIPAPFDTPLPQVQEAMTKPLIKITSDEPIPDKAIGKGLLRGAGRLAEGMTTAENVLMLLGLGASPGGFKQMADDIFKVHMTVGAVDETVRTGELIKEGQYGEAAASGVQALGQAAMAHGPMIARELRKKYGKQKADAVVKTIQKDALAESLDALDKVLDDPSYLSEVTKAERAAFIEAELTKLDRLRQSPKGYELLKEQLRQQELESRPKTKTVQVADEIINKRLERAAEKGLPVRENLKVIETAEPPINTPEGSVRRMEQIRYTAQLKQQRTLITDGLNETFRAIRELSGADRVGIQPYSEYNYRAAKPHFEAAWKSYKEAGQSFAKMSKDLIDKYGPEVVPYLSNLEADVRPATVRVPTTNEQATTVKGSETISAKKSYLLPNDKVDPWTVAREVHNLRVKTGEANGSFESLDANHVRNMVQKVRDMTEGKREMDPYYERVMKDMLDPVMQIPLEDLSKVAPETPIVQRKGPGKDNPYKKQPITAGDFAGLQELVAIAKDGFKFPKYFENPIYTVERLSKWAKETIYDPMIEGEHRASEQLYGIQRDFKQTVKAAKSMEYQVVKKDGTTRIKTGMPDNWRDRVGTYALSRRFSTRKAIEMQGDKIPTFETLTPGEQHMYNWARAKGGFFDQMYEQTNAVRKFVGDKPFPYTEDYITAARIILDLDNLGQQPFHTSGTVDPWIHPNAPSLPMAKEAKLNPRPVDTNFERLVMQYAQKATDYIHKAPTISKQREYLKQFKDSRGEPVINTKTDAPDLHKWWSDYLDYNAGIERPRFTPGVDRALNSLSRNLAFSMLSGNIHATLIQPSAYRNVFTMIGTKYAAKGIGSMFNETSRKFALDHLGVRERSFDVNIFDASRPYHGMSGLLARGVAKGTKLIGGGEKAQKSAVRRTAKAYEFGSNTKQNIGEFGLAGLKTLDKETAIAAANGAYYYAKESLGYSETQARRYARDTMNKTQASASRANRAPIQRDAVGKMLTLFQTFTINEWNFVKRDVLGLGHNMPLKTRAARIGRYAVSGALINMIYQSLNTSSPLPEPIAAYDNALERGLSDEEAATQLLLELMQPVPMIGGAKFGNTPLGAGAETIGDITGAISGDPFAPSLLELGGRVAGVPGTQQWAKQARAAKKAEKAAQKSTTNRRQRSSGRTRRERSTR